ncbi:hypothetical protein [Marinobacter lutaoensis]|uniref:hypothetical protein n=1 Tax=Marinobacter lutaoensis TaxID=135739 RepID=UPI001594B33D|nr:hypothetical protein [Marinobacter lutaoensis]NVD36820.1 hypothetical protein [Marinobacter lutaoensis]
MSKTAKPVLDAIGALFDQTFIGGEMNPESSPKLDYMNALTDWRDSGDKEPLVTLLESGIVPPAEALPAVAHILNDGPRGVPRRHQSYDDLMDRLIRRSVSVIEKEDLLAEIETGAFVKKRGESVNEIVAERVNKKLAILRPRGKGVIATKKTVEEDTKGMTSR